MFAQLRSTLPIAVLLSAASLGLAQQPAVQQPVMNNEAVLKLTSTGLSENLVVATVNATPGHYDTGTDALIALKRGGLTDRELAAIILKNGNPDGSCSATTVPPVAQPASVPNAVNPLDPNAKPRIYLQSESHGTSLKSRRDQSMEMSKDFEKNCPAVRITINQSLAAYTIMLNHVEGDFSRTNQIQIADHNGDLISRTKEGGTIAGDVKKACAIIVADWTKTSTGAAQHPSSPGN